MSTEKISYDERVALEAAINWLAEAIPMINHANANLDELAMKHGWDTDSWMVAEAGLKIASVLADLIKDRKNYSEEVAK